ncbi:MAG: proteasome accessory factor PafA2 family protein [Candidatus Spechtbacterales bacterium]
MPDKPRKIIIGAETEYGIFATENGQILDNEALGLVREAENVTKDFFLRPLEGIEDTEEHENLDSMTDEDFLRQPESYQSSGERQRRGLTGFVLSNGCRFYVDMGHPEYSIPETTNPMDALVAQKAGDRIVELCRRLFEERLKNENRNISIRLDKNNSDGKGNSYAAHENYSLTPETFTEITNRYGSRELEDIVLNFFTTRQIVTGAGKVGYETGRPVPYQISQRADFIEKEKSLNTVEKRGIINLRDHSYAGYDDVRRLHVICGDGNMSELSLYLKFGTTALILMMLESGFIQSEGSSVLIRMQNPVRSYKNVSRDLSLGHKIFFEDGSKRTALAIQEEFYSLAKKFTDGNDIDPIWRDVADKWEKVLHGLAGERNSDEWAGNLDWVKKETILKRHQEKKGVSPLHHTCRAVDLQYHNINPEKSIYWRLAERGDILLFATKADIERAINEPPSDTRAWFRGQTVKQFRNVLDGIGWQYIKFADKYIFMGNPFSGSKEAAESIFAGVSSPEEFIERLSKAIERKESGLEGFSVGEGWLI